MQLSDLSAVTKMIDALNTGSKEVGDVFNALSEGEQKAIVASNLFSDVQKEVILANIEVEKSAGGVALSNKGVELSALETAGAEGVEAGATNTLSDAFTGLGVALKQAAKTTIKFLATNPIGWAIMAGTAIVGVTLAYKKWGNTLENVKKRADESVESYKNLQSEVDKLSSELDSVNQKIDEINNKGKLSFTDKSELKKLKQQSSQLERQYELKKKLADIEAVESAADTADAFDKNYGGVDSENVDNYIKEGNIVWDSTVKSGADLERLLGSYNVAKNKLEVLQEQYNELLNNKEDPDREKTAASFWETSIQSQIDGITSKETELANVESDLLKQEAEMRDGYEIALNNQSEGKTLTSDEQKVIASYDEIRDTLEKIYQYTDEGKYKTLKFDEIFDTNGVEKTKDELIELSQQGGINKNTLDSYPKLKKAIDESGLSIDEFINEVSLATQKEQEMADATNNLSDATSKLADINNSISGISNALATKKDEGFVDINTLSGFDDVVKGMDTWTEFARILGDSTSSMEDAQAAANALATEYVNSKEFLSELTEENKGYYITQLEAMGVENAEEIVLDSLAQKHAELAAQKEFDRIASDNDAKGIANEINALIEEGNVAPQVATELQKLALQKQLVNGTTLDFSEDLTNIRNYVKGITGAATALSALQAQKSGKYIGDTKAVEQIKKRAQAEVDAALNSGSKANISTSGVKISPSGSSSYKAPSSSSGSGSSEKDTTKDYDLIEIAISRVERSITNLGKAVSRTYIGWSKRNSALLSEMGEVNREIDLQQRAYDAYMNQAYASGLSQPYIDMFANGSISFFTTTDEALQKQIDTFKEYYDKALSCADAIEDLRDNLAELAKTKFDNVSKQFDNIQSDITHTSDMINAFMEQTEASGHIVSERYYQTLISTENSNIDVLKKKYQELNKALVDAMAAGKIEMYSEQWYEMKTSINEVEKAIEDAKKSLIDYNNEMRQINWDLFDRRQNMISDIQEEANFLIEAMKVGNKLFNEDNGKPTEYGIASEGLHAVNYNAYMEQSKHYAEEIKKIDAELANDSSNTKLLDRREELIKQQREMIKNANSEKEAIRDLVEEGYQAMLDALQKLIDKRKELMSTEKD